MSKCKAVLDGEKITEIRVRTKKAFVGRSKNSSGQPVAALVSGKADEKDGQ